MVKSYDELLELVTEYCMYAAEGTNLADTYKWDGVDYRDKTSGKSIADRIGRKAMRDERRRWELATFPKEVEDMMDGEGFGWVRNPKGNESKVYTNARGVVDDAEYAAFCRAKEKAQKDLKAGRNAAAGLLIASAALVFIRKLKTKLSKEDIAKYEEEIAALNKAAKDIKQKYSSGDISKNEAEIQIKKIDVKVSKLMKKLQSAKK